MTIASDPFAPSILGLVSSSPGTPPAEPLDFNEFDDILDDIRTRHEETPQWEFCEGFLAAVLCMRCAVPQAEYFAVLLDGWTHPEQAGAEEEKPVFASAAQQARFLALWEQRWSEVQAQLQADARTLQDANAYIPSLDDVRAALANLPDEEQAAFENTHVPSFGQVWALGFMYAVESWPEAWKAPKKDKQAAALIDNALQAIVALTEDDLGVPEIAPFDRPDAETDTDTDTDTDTNNQAQPAPPTVSAARMETMGAALWAVYDLYDLWKSLGPRVETVRHAAALPGRNAPCFCGSGKKYKKCHGAGG